MTIAQDTAGPQGIEGLIQNPTFTYTPNGTLKGVVVHVNQALSANQPVSGCTYGGVPMTEVTGSPLVKTTGENGVSSCFFLGTGIPPGAQPVVVSSLGSRERAVTCYGLTAAADTLIQDIQTLESDSLADPSVTLLLGGNESFCSIGWFSGHGVPGNITPFANWTLDRAYDPGSSICGQHSYNIIAAADVLAGYNAGIDDVAMIAIAIKEDAAGTPAPEFDGTIDDLNSVNGVPFTYDASVHFGTGGPVTSYSLQNAPAWMSISALGVISGTQNVDAIVSGITVTGAGDTAPDAVSNAFTSNGNPAYTENAIYGGQQIDQGSILHYAPKLLAGVPDGGTQDGGTSATVFSDSTLTNSYTINEFVDLIIQNRATGASGVVTANDGTTITVASLTGGTRQDWQNGDTMAVVADIASGDTMYCESPVTVISESVDIDWYILDGVTGLYTELYTQTITGLTGVADGEFTVALDTVGVITLTPVAIIASGSHVNDAILIVTGGPTVNEGLAVWYGKTSTETINDAEYRWLGEQGATGTLNDRWFEFTGGLGYEGALNDRQLQYWLNGGSGTGSINLQYLIGGPVDAGFLGYISGNKGDLTPNVILGQTIDVLVTQDNGISGFTVAGDVQIGTFTGFTIEYPVIGDVVYTWNAGASQYDSAGNIALYNYLNTIVDQSIGIRIHSGIDAGGAVFFQGDPVDFKNQPVTTTLED